MINDIADPFEELSGRIEGLAGTLLCLMAQMEVDGMMDGPAFTSALRRSASGRSIAGRPDCADAARRMMSGMAVELDAMRDRRLQGR